MNKAGILSKLEKTDLSQVSAVLGFDACIDNIIRVVRGKDEKGSNTYFDDSSEFGEFLIGHQGISCGVELETRLSKIGGNMVIMANALGNLGVKCYCIGTFGMPEILPVFRSMSTNCSLYTVSETITASAMEFNDSKKIMFDPGPYNYLRWKDVKERLGIDTIVDLFSGRRLISLVNWSEIAESSEIWKGLIDEVFPVIRNSGSGPFVFVDFSDCSRKPAEEVRKAVLLLAEFRKYFRVTVSLNQNEASVISMALRVNEKLPDKEFVKEMCRAMGVNEFILHRTKDAIAYNNIIYTESDTFYCPEPKILTGGGDNFNAGYCFAKFLGFNFSECLFIANAVSGYYVKYGKSSSVNDLAEFIKKA